MGDGGVVVRMLIWEMYCVSTQGLYMGGVKTGQVGNELYSSMRTRSAKHVFGFKTQIPVFCMHTCFELGWKAGGIHEENKEQKDTGGTLV